MKPQDRARHETLGIRFIDEPADVVAAVNDRLREWKDYHEHRSLSQPGRAYTIAAKVADELYKSRIPILQISTPDPKIDLRVTPDYIRLLYRQHFLAVEDRAISHPGILNCDPKLDKYSDDKPFLNFSRVREIFHPERNPLFSKPARRKYTNK